MQGLLLLLLLLRNRVVSRQQDAVIALLVVVMMMVVRQHGCHVVWRRWIDRRWMPPLTMTAATQRQLTRSAAHFFFFFFFFFFFYLGEEVDFTWSVTLFNNTANKTHTHRTHFDTGSSCCFVVTHKIPPPPHTHQIVAAGTHTQKHLTDPDTSTCHSRHARSSFFKWIFANDDERKISPPSRIVSVFRWKDMWKNVHLNRRFVAFFFFFSLHFTVFT